MKVKPWGNLNFRSFGLGFFIQTRKSGFSVSIDLLFYSCGFVVYKDIYNTDLW
jgi:hypothetical protein